MTYFITLLLAFISCFSLAADSRSHSVLVSIAPYEYFAKRIVGDTEQVILFVPPGASPHYFEPNAKQVLLAGKSDIWFIMGEGFERNAIPPIQKYNPKIKIVDLRDGIDPIYEAHACCASHGDPDPHIWMSLRDGQKQAKTIAEALTLTYPEHQELYASNLVKLQSEMRQADEEISALLQPYKGRSIMVSHPAFAYFCRDYDLHQLSIEFEGKDPSPRQLTEILEQGRKEKIGTIFIQAQHSSKGARLVAHELHAKTVDIDPLSENYLENVKEIAKKFYDSFQ